MASRAETSGWSYHGGSGSIWQGNNPNPPLVRGSFDHDDPTWRGWQSGIDHNHEFKRADPRHSSTSSPQQPPDSDSNTLYMGNLEPWMDHEYASQVVRLMGWDRTATASGSQVTQNNAVTIKIPPPPPDTMPQPNNPGYCLITFPSAAQAASVLASLNPGNGKGSASAPLLMPNSSRPFNLQWANTQFPHASAGPAFGGSVHNTSVFNGLAVQSGPSGSTTQGPQREFSIFVGDLAPETSNSDLVAVFRNPVLGLRNDREPKFIRPFYSCKSAKIMLDPVTGVSRGYGFVRFTDEADQQRALIEMHGLYCLSRPMRVSPATAKFKPNAATSIPTQPTPVSLNLVTQVSTPEASEDASNSGVNNGRAASLVTSVSSPVAAASSVVSSASVPAPIINSTSSNASSIPTPAPANPKRNVTSTNGPSPPPRQTGSSGPEPAMQGDPQIAPQVLAQIAQLAANNSTSQEWNTTQLNQQTPPAAGMGSFPSSSSMSSQPPPYSGQSTMLGGAGTGTGLNSGGGAPNVGSGVYEEAWTHQAQARAILGNLIGPNGEQLTSTDPYNTTVFVGGLSPLISEETLRTFFAPFGEIHYVKVPLGKHCGFVQFVRKADAERAIERMQGFPIGGSRIRLSWGRSQYKAAQAAAQAAQAAQAEQVARFTASSVNAQNPTSLHITPDQALQLLQSIGYNPSVAASSSFPSEDEPSLPASQAFHNNGARQGNTLNASEQHEFTNAFMPSEHSQRSTFSPFSPASNAFTGADEQQRQHPIMTPSPSQPLPHPSRSYAPGFGPSPSSVPGKYNDTHSPHSSSTESSSGSSSVRFSGIGNGSSGFPNAAFLENPSGTFQVNDILRHDSQTLHPRVASTSSHTQDQSARTTPPRHQQRPPTHNGLHLRETSGTDFMHDLNGTLASLDLGERYPRAPIGSEMLMKDGYGQTGDTRPLSKSISAPLKGLVSPRPQSGGSPDST